MAAVVAVMTVTGCGRGELEVGTPPPSERAVAPTTVVREGPDGLDVRVHPGSWRLIGTGDGGRLLQIEVGVGGCTRFKQVDVAETRDTVEIVAVMETTVVPAIDDQDGPPFIACTSELGLKVEEVRLSEPLGDRRLVGECSGGEPTCRTFPSSPVRRR